MSCARPAASCLLVAAVSVLVTLPPAPATGAKPDAATRAAMGAMEMAKLLYKEGKYGKAAEFFHQAYAVKPIPGFLFNAARSEQRVFKLKEARRDFERLLKLEELDAQTRKRAKMHLKEIAEAEAYAARLKAKAGNAGATAAKRQPEAPKQGALKPTPKGERKATIGAKLSVATKTPDTTQRAAAPAIGKSTAPPSTWHKTVGWPVLGVGVGVVGFGIWSLLAAQGAQAGLDSHINNETGKFKSTISLQEARADQDAINGQIHTGWIATGVGLGLASAGVWLVTRSPWASASLAPMSGGRGVLVTARF